MTIQTDPEEVSTMDSRIIDIMAEAMCPPLARSNNGTGQPCEMCQFNAHKAYAALMERGLLRDLQPTTIEGA